VHLFFDAALVLGGLGLARRLVVLLGGLGLRPVLALETNPTDAPGG
jgi:hypothetical protein